MIKCLIACLIECLIACFRNYKKSAMEAAFLQQKLIHRCLTEWYIGLRKYWNFRREIMVEQIVAIGKTHSVSSLSLISFLNLISNSLN